MNIYGFSFYLDGFMSGVKDGLEKNQAANEYEFVKKCFNSKRHNQKNMWRHAKNTLLENNAVSLDPILNKILSMDNFSKDGFHNV